MARGENKDEFGIGGEEPRPCISERGFLALKRAAGNDNPQTGCHRLQQARGFGFLSGAHVELEIAGDRDAIGEAAKREQAISVDLALGQHAAEAREQRAPQAAQPLVARP